MDLSSNLLNIASSPARRKIAVVAAAAFAASASPAAAQYGSGPPLPPLPALQSVAGPQGEAGPQGPQGEAGPQGPQGVAGPQGVPGAVGGGEAIPAEGTTGPVVDTGVGSAPVRVVSSEAAQPVAAADTGALPFTGARIGVLAAIGGSLLALGVGLRRRFTPPTKI